MSLRDELAAVLGPGNNELVAYEQAGYVCEVLVKYIDRMIDDGYDSIDAADKLFQEIGWT